MTRFAARARLLAAAVAAAAVPAALAVPAAASTPSTATTVSTASAPSTTSTASAPTAPDAAGAPPLKSVTRRVDVDGDGRLDTITVRTIWRRGYDCRFTVTVSPARGAAVTMPVRMPNCENHFGADGLWAGSADVDGQPGSEFMLDFGGYMGDFPWLHTYAVRGGKIVALPAPGSSNRLVSWDVVGPYPFPISGYTFSTRGGVRYVVHHELTPSRSGRTYTGTDTTYRWAGTSWARVSRAPAKPVSRAAAEKNVWLWHGITWRS